MISASPMLRAQLNGGIHGGQFAGFDGAAIRIGANTLARWRASYRHIPDWPAVLQAIDDYCAANPADNARQIARASSWLERRNGQYRENSDEATAARDRSF